MFHQKKPGRMLLVKSKVKLWPPMKIYLSLLNFNGTVALTRFFLEDLLRETDVELQKKERDFDSDDLFPGLSDLHEEIKLKALQ